MTLDTKQEALELAKNCGAELWNRPLQQNMSAEIIFEDEEQLQAFYNEARKPLEEELAAAQARENAAFCIHCGCPVFNAPSAIDALYTVKHQEHEAGYNQCLKELSEKEPLYFADIYLHCLAGRSLILRPTYPKE